MNVLITGGNRGIGLELVRKYAQNTSTKVYATCREASDDLKKIEGVKIIENIDVCNDESFSLLKESLNGVELDVLISNAGVLYGDDFENLNFENISKQFEVNALGMLKVISCTIDNVKKGGKIGILTSRMGSVEDNTSGGQYGYRMSKAAANAMGKSLALDLREKEISVAILHPGYVQTEMTGGQGHIGPSESADGLVKVMEKLNLSNTGTFWHSDGSELPW